MQGAVHAQAAISGRTYLRVHQETELSVDVSVDDLFDPRPKFDTPVAARLCAGGECKNAIGDDAIEAMPEILDVYNALRVNEIVSMGLSDLSRWAIILCLCNNVCRCSASHRTAFSIRASDRI